MIPRAFTGKIISHPLLFIVPVICFTTVFLGIAPAFGQDIQPVASVAADRSEIDRCGLTEDEVDAGWIALFDGVSEFGWRAESKANWSIENGVISVSKGDAGLFRTTSQFDDFELILNFKIEAETNSGIFIRTSPKPKDPASDCYEINLAAPKVSPFPTGTLVKRKAGDDVSEGNKDWFNQWHEMRIVANGPLVEVMVDGERTVSYTDPAGESSLGKGYIGLQLNQGLAQFKSIKLRPLNVVSLFDGKSLDGWKTDQKLESRFEVTENRELQILSGRGQIESESTFGNFVFSMKCRTNAEGLNSGVFFRCIPGDLMNGYESQIQNRCIDDNRTKPEDCGTGGIFRRKNARRVNANDNEWFTKTIIANGPRIAVWVNGFQVTDWSDQRKPNKNPRKGRRLEAGTIIFQGHDPTTDILIKDIGARELNSRNR